MRLSYRYGSDESDHATFRLENVAVVELKTSFNQTWTPARITDADLSLKINGDVEKIHLFQNKKYLAGEAIENMEFNQFIEYLGKLQTIGILDMRFELLDNLRSQLVNLKRKSIRVSRSAAEQQQEELKFLLQSKLRFRNLRFRSCDEDFGARFEVYTPKEERSKTAVRAPVCDIGIKGGTPKLHA